MNFAGLVPADTGIHTSAGRKKFNVSLMILMPQHLSLSDTEALVKDFQGNTKCLFNAAINCFSFTSGATSNQHILRFTREAEIVPSDFFLTEGSR